MAQSMTHNFDAGLLGQMQQQFVPSGSVPAPSDTLAAGQAPNISTVGQGVSQPLTAAASPLAAANFQPQQGHNAQDIRTESMLAVALLANDAPRNDPDDNNNDTSISNHPGQTNNNNPSHSTSHSPQVERQQAPQPLMANNNALLGLEGVNLEQLQSFNSFQSINQPNSGNVFQFGGLQSPSGVQGLQQQLASLQQQVQQQHNNSQGIQQNPSTVQQLQVQQQIGLQQQLQQLQQQQQLQQGQHTGQQGFSTAASWMGQNISGQSAFNPAAFGIPLGNTGGDQNNTMMEQFGNPFNNMQQGNTDRNLMGIGLPNTHQQQQPNQQLLGPQGGQLASFSNLVSFQPSGGGKQKMPHLFQSGFFSNPAPTTTAGSIETRIKHSKKQEKKKKSKTFPDKLMQALMESSDEEAVAWLPDGKSFVIVNPDAFCTEIINNTFKDSKYASFVRKLHRWGFVRLTSGTGTDCFHHPMFQRNRKEMAGKMTCAPRGDKEKDRLAERLHKPPSLAGVEKFIKAKFRQGIGGTTQDAKKNGIANALSSVPLLAQSGVSGLDHDPAVPSVGI
jgi:hypothetical protein